METLRPQLENIDSLHCSHCVIIYVFSDMSLNLDEQILIRSHERLIAACPFIGIAKNRLTTTVATHALGLKSITINFCSYYSSIKVRL